MALLGWRAFSSHQVETILASPNPLTVADDSRVTKCRLWLDEARSRFALHLLEDKWDDWPYPHQMDYFLQGELCGRTEAVIRSYIYQTSITDDFDGLTRKAEYELKEVDETGDRESLEISGKFCIIPLFSRYTIKAPKKYFRVMLEGIESDAPTITLLRFRRLWAMRSDGLDILEGGVNQKIVLHAEQMPLPPPSFSIPFYRHRL